MSNGVHEAKGDPKKPDPPKSFQIQIDRTRYEVFEEKLSGAQLRQVPSPPIPPERDLFQMIPGHPDKKIKDDDTVQIYDGLRLFTAPRKGFQIQIDRTRYEVFEDELSGAQLRQVPSPPIPPERDLFQVIPGHPDKKIKDDDTVQIYDGLRFFTAPNTINPGAKGPVRQVSRKPTCK